MNEQGKQIGAPLEDDFIGPKNVVARRGPPMTEQADKPLSDFDRGVQLGVGVTSKACGRTVEGTRLDLAHAEYAIVRPPDLHEPQLREACKCVSDDFAILTASDVEDVPDFMDKIVPDWHRILLAALAATEGADS